MQTSKVRKRKCIRRCSSW